MLTPWEALPGETPIDLSDLTDKVRSYGVTTRSELSLLEAKNIEPVAIKYLAAAPSVRIAPFDFSWGLKLHREMFCDVWKFAGELRQRDVNIGIKFYLVSGELQDVFNALSEWATFRMPMIEQAARLHHKAVRIHPFLNGNGRWSRMLANIWLKKHGVALIHWPEETIGAESIVRDEYIATIKATDDTHNYAQLIALHERYQGPAI